MADNVELNVQSGGETIATDDITVTGQGSAGQVQYVKLVDGTSNGTEPIAVAGGVEANALRVTIASNSTGLLSVDDNASSLTVDTTGTSGLEIVQTTAGDLNATVEIAAAQTLATVTTVGTVTTITNDVSIDDGGNSITVDNTVLSVVGGGAEATAQRVTIANDSTGVLSVDDNSSSLTVDTTGTSGLEIVQGTATDLKAEVVGTGTFVTQSSITSAAVIGPADPSIDSYANIAINLTTGADQVLVSSAANKQIWVYGYGFTCGDADGQSVSLQDQDDAAITGIMEFAQYGGISVPPSGNFSMPVFKLGTDKDLEIDILGGDVDGWLSYAILSV